MERYSMKRMGKGSMVLYFGNTEKTGLYCIIMPVAYC